MDMDIDEHTDPGGATGSDERSKRPSEESLQSPAKVQKTEDESRKAYTPPAKQLTLAATMKKQGSPYEILNRSSPGAKPRPSLLEVLSGQVAYEEHKAKEAKGNCIAVGVEGEDARQVEIENGSRDRFRGIQR